jgi:drug/metabolite transporter (DMT)-like permease
MGGVRVVEVRQPSRMIQTKYHQKLDTISYDRRIYIRKCGLQELTYRTRRNLSPLCRAGPSQQVSQSASNDDGDAVKSPQECYGTGMEVECVFDAETENAVVAEKEEQYGLDSLLTGMLLISPFFFWGTSMVAMKELAPHTTPMLVAAWRLLPSGLVLLLWAKASGNRGPTSAMGWLAVGLFGLVDGACFQGFLAEGLQRTSAGLGSVIIDSQPLSVAVIASVLFGETLGPIGLFGLLLGVGGLLMLEVSPSSLENFSLQSSGASLWDSGEWWMLLAAQSMAIGTVMVRWVSKYSDPIAATGWHMILGGIPLLMFAINENSATSLPEMISVLDVKDYLLLLYVSLLGSAASYGVFFYLATVRGSLTQLSSLTFLTPMFAALGGYLVLGETLTPLQLTGALVTILGVTCINAKK